MPAKRYKRFYRKEDLTPANVEAEFRTLADQVPVDAQRPLVEMKLDEMRRASVPSGTRALLRTGSTYQIAEKIGTKIVTIDVTLT